MSEKKLYRISSLGDTALVIDFGNVIDEQLNDRVLSLFYQLQKNPLPGITEAVPAYSSLAVYYDVLMIKEKLCKEETAFDFMSRTMEKFIAEQNYTKSQPGGLITIPVCYDKEFGADLSFIASQKNISTREIIRLHTSCIYRVYMLGFLPGFAYMGEVNEKLISPRKQQPVQVQAGSVGIAGKQTGIYPLASPGGWQIIGRTPLTIFNKDKEKPSLFQPGDRVQFISISKDEFEDSKGRSA